MTEAIAIGDRIKWNWTTPAGFGFDPGTPGIVEKLGAKRIQIRVVRQVAYSCPRRWVPVLKWVEPSSIEPRIVPCAALGEEMRIEVEGFVLTPWKHPIGAAAKQFPDGVWYGCVDGYGCGGPNAHESGALHSALHALRSGSYRSSILDRMAYLDRRRQAGYAKAGDAKAGDAVEMVSLRSSLAKLDAWAARQANSEEAP